MHWQFDFNPTMLGPQDVTETMALIKGKMLSPIKAFAVLVSAIFMWNYVSTWEGESNKYFTIDYAAYLRQLLSQP